MKKLNKKGFTIVELVIVIAVIAILAGVLIPTFSGIVNKAQDSVALQEARNAYTEYLAEVDAQPATTVYAKGGDKYFKVTSGKISNTAEATTPTTGVLVSMNGENVVIACAGAHTFADNATTGAKCTVTGCTGVKE